MALFFESGDREELLSQVTPLMAVDYLGLPTKRYGTNLSILCPNPEHHDQHYGSCMITHDGKRCTCFSQCGGRSYSALQILIWQGGYSFYDAMCVLADLAGRTEEYEASNRRNMEPQLREIRALTAEQKKQIKMAMFPKIKAVKNVTSKRPDTGDYFRDDNGDYVIYDSGNYRNPWLEMAKNDPDTLDWLIQNKCKEQMLTIDYLRKQIKDPLSSEASKAAYEIMKEYSISLFDMLNTLNDMYQEIEELYVTCGGRIRNPKKMLENFIALNLAFAS